MSSPTRFHCSAAFLLFGALIALNCSVDGAGLGGGGGLGADAQAADGRAADSGMGTGGHILTAGSGGTVGTGGGPSIGSGGATGGAAPGSGGTVATGGAAGARVSGSGGQPIGSGGAEPPQGGASGGGGSAEPGTGGVVGSGGAVGTGGMGTGGRGTGGAGTGGTAVPGTGGAAGSCNASSCPTGCCTTEGRCITTGSNARCGTGGAACSVCGNCFTCSAGACALVPTSRWDVICVSATIAPSRPNGRSWDDTGTGEPDPFCRSTLNGVTLARTDAITNTFSPIWNDDITPDRLPATMPDGPGPGGGFTSRITAAALMDNMGLSRWGVAVVDDDGGALLNDPVCAVTPALTVANFTAGTVTFPGTGSCLGLTIRLECAE